MTQRIIKGYGTKSRQMAWSNAKEKGISKGTHIYVGSYHSLDYFKPRINNNNEIAVRNLTFNNGGL